MTAAPGDLAIGEEGGFRFYRELLLSESAAKPDLGLFSWVFRQIRLLKRIHPG